MLNLLQLFSWALFFLFSILSSGYLTHTHDLYDWIEADSNLYLLGSTSSWVLTHLFNWLPDISTWMSQRHLKFALHANSRGSPSKPSPPVFCASEWPCVHLAAEEEPSLIMSSLSPPWQTILSQVLLIVGSTKISPTSTLQSVTINKIMFKLPSSLTWTIIRASTTSPCFHSPMHPSYFNYNGIFKTFIATSSPRQQ